MKATRTVNYEYHLDEPFTPMHHALEQCHREIRDRVNLAGHDEVDGSYAITIEWVKKPGLAEQVTKILDADDGTSSLNLSDESVSSMSDVVSALADDENFPTTEGG